MKLRTLVHTGAGVLALAATLALTGSWAAAHDYFVGGTPDKGGEPIFFEFLDDENLALEPGSYRVVRMQVGESKKVVVMDPGSGKAEIKADYARFRELNRERPGGFGSRIPAGDRPALEATAEERATTTDTPSSSPSAASSAAAFSDGTSARSRPANSPLSWIIRPSSLKRA